MKSVTPKVLHEIGGRSLVGHVVAAAREVAPDPIGYGRIIRSADGAVRAIVEQKDATAEQRAITEVNSGVYAFDAALLTDALGKITTDNAQGEEYLTDTLSILREAGHRVGAA